MSRIEAYLAAVADATEAHAHCLDEEATNAALYAVAHAYRNLTRTDCAQLWPGSPESRDPQRED